MTSETIKLPSFVKINWFLKVLGKRPSDDYHEICTVFQTVSLCDELTFEIADKLSLNCNDATIPTDENNLIIKAANLLKNIFNVKIGAKIFLDKKIPSPGGLGGGSSNAAVTLLGLATLWNLSVDFATLIELGKQLGADVPFFLYGGTALGCGNGNEISQIDDIEKKYLLIITPNISVSTQQAYADLNAPYLTKKVDKSILTVCRTQADRLLKSEFKLFNDFEKTVFENEPEIGKIKNKLLDLAAKNVLMCGSGASVFGIFDNEEKRQSAFNAFDDKNIRKFAVQTISREEYREYLTPCKHLIPKSL